MLWQCHRKAMKLAAYMTIHDYSYIHTYIHAVIIYYGKFACFLLPLKLSDSHKACSGHKCVHRSFATTFVLNIFHSVNIVSHAQGMCWDACSHHVKYLLLLSNLNTNWQVQLKTVNMPKRHQIPLISSKKMTCKHKCLFHLRPSSTKLPKTM